MHGNPKFWRGEANTGYIVEFIILEGGNLGWGWEIPGPPTLSMNPGVCVCVWMITFLCISIASQAMCILRTYILL